MTKISKLLGYPGLREVFSIQLGDYTTYWVKLVEKDGNIYKTPLDNNNCGKPSIKSTILCNEINDCSMKSGSSPIKR